MCILLVYFCLVFECFFGNVSRKFKFHSNLTWITCTLHEDQCAFLIISRSVLLRMKNVSDKFVEKLEAHILRSVTFFRKSFRLWDNVEKYCRAGQDTWHGSCALYAGYLRLQEQTLNLSNTCCSPTTNNVCLIVCIIQ